MFELLFQETFLTPSTLDVLWTVLVTGLLLSAATLITWLLPWSDRDVMAVHHTARTAMLSVVHTINAPSSTPMATSRGLVPVASRRLSSPR